MMKGKDKFTSAEILELRELIAERQNASRNYQKQLRNRMRKIGFFGRDDWGIIDCTLEDLDELIDTERIKIIDKITSKRSTLTIFINLQFIIQILLPCESISQH
jgi:hypothetical protein